MKTTDKVTVVVTSVLGEARDAVRFYADGTFDCPFCSYPVLSEQAAVEHETTTSYPNCSNPMCVADPLMAPATARKQLADRAAAVAEADRRDRLALWGLEEAEARARGDTREYVLRATEAKERKTCLRCATADLGRPARFVKHRATTACPNAGVA